ncbi:SagB/ThcOx family dehydrogenase [Candidatus Nitrospira bockiana]
MADTTAAGTSAAETDARVLQAIGYHQQTKHHFFRYARSRGYLDWANQPNPFRRYAGAPEHRLPILRVNQEPRPPRYDALYQAGTVPAQALTLHSLSRLFAYALAITAWKEAGGVRWALRSNPSSGNLHPTEGYLLIDRLPGLADHPALYHYAPQHHLLERRADWAPESFRRLMHAFPPQAFLVGLTSIHWRESWKYGERAYRYCQHDAGHAVGALRIAAQALGWHMILLEDLADGEISLLLGLDRDGDYHEAEREQPDCLAVVCPEHEDERVLPLGLPHDDVRHLQAGRWYGTANRLSRGEPDPWDIIDVVTQACEKPPTGPTTCRLGGALPPAPVAGLHRPVSAGEIIRQRRSALAFDGKTSVPAPTFFAMLTRVMPHADRPLCRRPMPWDGMPWEPAIHLGLFVHRVDGIPPGLYCLVRAPSAGPELREAMHGEFLWERPPGCPSDLPLFLLQDGDARDLATQVSCHQDIAGQSCFSLGMIADFERTLQQTGAWFYRRLFWETGVIGQVLYLEAEAAGLRATGIGCFFDDPVHQVFGLQDLRYQSLYHFTIGGHVEDPRLTTLPAYEEEVESVRSVSSV